MMSIPVDDQVPGRSTSRLRGTGTLQEVRDRIKPRRLGKMPRPRGHESLPAIVLARSEEYIARNPLVAGRGGSSLPLSNLPIRHGGATVGVQGI